jgi:ABC-type transport system involved in multi-copper enzyme maturation permease subunit
MKGLLLKDLLNLKNSVRSLLFIFIFYVIFSVATSNFSFVAGMSVLLCTMLTFTTFSYDEYNKWDRYALSTPVSRRTLVAGKYVLSLILTLFGGAISFLALLCTYAVNQSIEKVGENALSILGVMAVSVLFSGIILPIIFKFGVEKGRLLLFVVLAIPSGLIFILYRLGVTLPSEAQLMTWLIGFLFLILLIFFFSFYVSCRIYAKKDL